MMKREPEELTICRDCGGYAGYSHAPDCALAGRESRELMRWASGNGNIPRNPPEDDREQDPPPDGLHRDTIGGIGIC